MDHCRILLATMLVAMNMFFSNSRVGSLDNIHIDIHNPTLTPLSDSGSCVGDMVPGPWLILETQLKWCLTNTRPLEETPLRILSMVGVRLHNHQINSNQWDYTSEECLMKLS